MVQQEKSSISESNSSERATLETLMDGTCSMNGVSSSSSVQTAAEVQTTLGSLSGASNVPQDDLIAMLRSSVNQNLELKETLAQNNLALRQQLALVVRWSQQCQQQQQQLASKNQELRELQRQINSFSSGREPLVSDQQNADVSELQRQGQRLQEDKNRLTSLKAKLEADVTLLKCDLSTSRGDVERLQLERAHLQATNAELKQQLRQHHLNQQLLNSLEGETRKERELNELRRTVDELKIENLALRADLARSQQRLASMEASALKKTTAEDVQQNTDTVKLQEEIVLLKEDVEVLEKTLQTERARLAEERQLSLRAANELAALHSELKDATDTIHRNANTDHYYQAKIKSINEQHDAVTAKLLSYEELLTAKNEEISKLKKESGQAKARIAELQSEGETIAILRAQVEVYQGDFRAEREAREAMASEREQLRDELRQLQIRNTQLLDELHAAQRVPDKPTSLARPADSKPRLSPQRRLSSHTDLMEQLSMSLDNKEAEKKKTSTPPVDESLFYCPKCNSSFTELRPLEEHVNRCLDED